YDIRSQLLDPNNDLTNRSCYEVAEFSRVLRRYDEAEHYFLRALDVDNKTGGRDPDFSALIRNNLAEVYVALARYDEARPLMDEALAIRERHHGRTSEHVSRSQMAIARLLLHGGEPAGALALARAGVKRKDKANESSWDLVLAGALLATEDYEGAERIYKAMFEQTPLTELDRGIML